MAYDRLLDGKVALITGASQGAGRGAALRFAAAGAAVALLGRSLPALEKVARDVAAVGGAAEAIRCDVGSLDDITAAVQRVVTRFGAVDIAVNAAQSPSMRAADLLTVDRETMDSLWRTGPVATLEVMRAVHPHMLARGGGSIINFGSGAQFTPAGYGMYAAAKASIQMITRAAAVEWGADGIRANLVVPLVVSPAYEEAVAADPTIVQTFQRTVPLQRVGDPVDDIGPALVFLASDQSRYVTGTTLMLDGGQQFLR